MCFCLAPTPEQRSFRHTLIFSTRHSEILFSNAPHPCPTDGQKEVCVLSCSRSVLMSGPDARLGACYFSCAVIMGGFLRPSCQSCVEELCSFFSGDCSDIICFPAPGFRLENAPRPKDSCWEECHILRAFSLLTAQSCTMLLSRPPFPNCFCSKMQPLGPELFGTDGDFCFLARMFHGCHVLLQAYIPGMAETPHRNPSCKEVVVCGSVLSLYSRCA